MLLKHERGESGKHVQREVSPRQQEPTDAESRKEGGKSMEGYDWSIFSGGLFRQIGSCHVRSDKI